MAKLRPLIPVTLGVLIGSALLFLLLRGFRDKTGVPDTSSTVGEVTSDPDPRPSSAGPDGPMRADGPADSNSGATTPDTAARPTGLRGLVLDDTGRAVAGARITLRPVRPEALRGAPVPDGPLIAETDADRDGRFAIDLGARSAAPAWLRITAAAEGHATRGRLLAGLGADVVLVLPPSGVLTVTVVDPAGKPIPAARVEAHVDQTRVETQTNTDGLATFDQLPPGDASVRAGADGFGTVRAGPVRITSGSTASLDVGLTPGVMLAGVVRDDASGAPIADAVVRLARPGQASEPATTDAQGRFEATFAGGVGERVFVSVDADGYAPALAPVVLRPVEDGPQTTEVRLRRAEPWRGQVLFPRDVRADYADVVVRYTENGVAGRAPASTTPDANGAFELPPPPSPAPGRRIVLVAETGGLRGAIALRPGQLPPSPLLLVLTPSAQVSGRVTTGEGAAAGALVRLVPKWTRESPGGLTPDESLLRAQNEEGLVGLTAATDAAGTWSVRGVPRATYELFVEWRGRQHWTGREIEVTGGLDAGTIALDGGTVIEGTVRDVAGADLSGARVRLIRTGERPRVIDLLTTSDGSFRYAGLAPGRYEVRVSLTGFATLVAEAEVADGDEDPAPLDLRMDRAAAIEGRLRLDGKPYRGTFQVSLRFAGSSRAAGTPTTLRTSDGRYRLDAVPSGALTLRITAAGGLLGILPDTLDARPGDVLRADVDLVPGARLEGRVRTSAGDPVPAARVTLRGETSGMRHLATAMADGRYLFEGLEAGAYTMRVTGTGGVPVTRRIVLDLADRETVDPVLPIGGHARITVVDAEGRKIGGALLLFRNVDGVYPVSPPDRTGSDGTAVRRNLPAGPMTVRARLRDLEGSASFDLVTNETTDARVVVTPRGS